jgi:hypothetical protein
LLLYADIVFQNRSIKFTYDADDDAHDVCVDNDDNAFLVYSYTDDGNILDEFYAFCALYEPTKSYDYLLAHLEWQDACHVSLASYSRACITQ